MLEALAHTDLNLVLITEFNYTVALDAARYWTQDNGSLAQLINQFDKQENFAEYGQRAKEIIVNYYTWEKIVEEYEDLFLHES